MNIRHRLLFFCSLLVPLTALALDATPSVKVSEVLKTGTSWDGKAVIYPSGKAEITGLIVELAPGGETGWHQHSLPSFAYILEGTLEVTLADGRKNRLQAGQALAEVVDVLHNGRNVGTTPVRLIVFYAGEAGRSLSQKSAPPPTPR